MFRRNVNRLQSILRPVGNLDTMADETFEDVGSGASLTVPVAAGQLRKGDFVCINDFPCKVVDISTSKTGKHGHAKANITAIDVFTGKKYEEVSPTSHMLPAPIVKRSELMLIDITEDGHLSLMDEANNTRDDLTLPNEQELADAIKADFDAGKEVTIVVMGAMGKECVMGHRVPT
jgi:translation initiation factor 5A